jgi:hypothetical protein
MTPGWEVEPSIVYVLPEPVTPYAMMVAFYT